MDKESQITLPYWFIAFSFIFLNACTTIPVDQRQEIRDEVDLAAAETFARMVAQDSTVQDALDQENRATF